MGWAKTIAKRDSFADPSENTLAALAGQPTFAGKRVTPVNALTLIPVWRAINIRAGALGSMPLEVFRKITNDDGSPGQTLASPSSRPWQLLHDKANEIQTAAECWKLVESHLASWGNAFIWKERGSDGRVANIWPMDPRRVQVGRDQSGNPVFLVSTFAPTPPGENYIVYGEQIVCTDYEILHIRALSRDGLVGLSPIQAARQTIGTMMAQEEYEGRFWANDASPGTVLVHPNKLTPEGMARIKALWNRDHRGPDNARKVGVLGESIAIKQMTVPMSDAQFVQIAQMRRTDIALLFGLPPYMLAGATGGGMTYSNTETQSTDLVKWSLRDEMTTIESAVSWDPDIIPISWFAQFNADTILRGSQTERFASYGTAPHLTVDEVRAIENMPPLGGDKGSMLAKEVGPQVLAALAKADPTLGSGLTGIEPTKGVQTEPAPATEPTADPTTGEPTQTTDGGDAAVGPSLDGGN